jgi:hypothetical protein
MINWVKLLTVSLLFVSSASATPSYLALCHKKWNCAETLSTFGDIIKTGWLDNTFGTRCSCVTKLLDDPRDKILRVHIMNSPCMRNSRCGRYELLHGETARSASKKINRGNRKFLNRYKRRVRILGKRIAKAKGNVKLYVSPCLECDIRGKARKRLLAITASLLPDAILVDNPYRQRCIKGVVCEKHGIKPKLSAPCIVDLDGVDGGVVDVRKWLRTYSHCELQYYWNYGMNCISGSFVDPRLRSCALGRQYFFNLRKTLCQYYTDLSSDICSPL